MPSRREAQLLSAVGASICQHREAHGWTQKELAEIAGVNRVYLSRLENGAGNVSLITLLKVADALGVGIVDLFAGIKK